MTVNLKIEIIKIFSLEFNISSDKNKKEEENVEKDNGDDTAVESK